MIAVIAFAAMLAPQVGFAHEGEDHSAAAAHSQGPSATKQETLASLQQSVTALEALVESKNYKDIHEASENVGKAAEALLGASDIQADKQVRLKGAVDQLKMQLDKLHDAADANNQEVVTSSMKKVKAALTLIEAQTK